MTAVQQPKGALAGAPGSEAAEVLHVFASFGYGGVPIRMSRIINHLGRRYRHCVVALDGCFDSRSRIEPTIDIRYLDVETTKGNPFQAVWQARRAIAGLRPDLVMTYNWGAVEWAMAASLLRGCRQIHCESGFGLEEARRQIPRRALFRRLALRRIESLIVPSQTLVEIARTAWRIDPAKIVCIPNGVEIARFARPPDPRALEAAGLTAQPGRLRVGTAAPLRPEKNVARLVRAFARLPRELDAGLVILGDGGERGALESLARELGIAERVVFAGHVEAPERLLGALDLFVLSSETEQMPNSLIQAMAAGLPVAATDVGDIGRILPELNRPYVVPAEGDRPLAEAMEALLGDRQLRVALGRANSEQVRENYGEGLMLDRYTAVLGGADPGAEMAP